VVPKHLSERDFGKLLAHPPAPRALPKSPSLPALVLVDGGRVFAPSLCSDLVNSGEAAAASPAGWKVDGSWVKAPVPCEHRLPAAREGMVV